MWFGAHLPLIDVDGSQSVPLARYVEAAQGAGCTAICANDHLVFSRPWLDGLVALSSVLGSTADMTVATTVALPVIRGPATLAKAAAALGELSGGRFVLGVGPGSSAADYAAAGIPFDERWPRFDEAVHLLRSWLAGEPETTPGRFYGRPLLEPQPSQPIPIWIGSWGSAAGLRRVGRLGDGWLASAYNTTPDRIAAGREYLRADQNRPGRPVRDLPIVLATMWTHVTESPARAQAWLDDLARMLRRDPDTIAEQLLIGSADHCVRTLTRFADAGVDGVVLWPVGDPLDQLRRVGDAVIPHLR
ncbi:LLM class flavin-dependent oxidoreductase [Gordonia sp. OPL2]|uniref:LLM class flavin-dependent oxidoreductase n=1 Tax=Gordonia sp. OPL2 TaxID=2486274 RepID=UPI001654D7F6|nr:LLM class flavin-dependent oxidoreductase [Gordonia sp. OPL2]RPA19850.1 LLM class flavin-dependent oxidoreductase [Gordonia sp. OPL2]